LKKGTSGNSSVELKDPEAQEKMDAVEKAVDIGFQLVLASLESMGFKLEDKQKEKLKTTYAMAYLMTSTTML
jgi:hypothetical protein